MGHCREVRSGIREINKERLVRLCLLRHETDGAIGQVPIDQRAVVQSVRPHLFGDAAFSPVHDEGLRETTCSEFW